MEHVQGSRGQAGFTIIESMIAMFFLAYIVSQMGLVMLYASRTTNLSQRVTRANALAEEAVEKSRNTTYNSLQLPNTALGESCTTTPHDAAIPVNPNVVYCSSVLDNNRFERVRTVSPEQCVYTTTPATCTSKALLESNRSRVDVSVYFTDAAGRPQAIRVASIVSRYY
jgi:Tfp pilus assembly protein PilV